MSTMPVEVMVSEEALNNIKFLAEVPFNPPERRGTVLGLIGRLKHEPKIEDDPEEDRSRGYHKGVTPGERLQVLERLFRELHPVRTSCPHAENLLQAVDAELSQGGYNMTAVLEEEALERKRERRAFEQRQREHQERMERQAAEKALEASLKACYMCEEKFPAEEMQQVEEVFMCADCASEWVGENA